MIAIGAFVLVNGVGFAREFYYVGQVVERVDALEWKVDFYKRTPQGTFIKPPQPDISLVEDDQCVTCLPPPTTAGTTARTLGSVDFSQLPRGIDI